MNHKEKNVSSLWWLVVHSFVLLHEQERLNVIGILVLLVTASSLDAVSMVGVMPLISVIVEPGLIETNEVLRWIYRFFDAPTPELFISFLAAGAVFLIIFSMAGSLFIQYVVRRFVVSCQNRLANELVSQVIDAPYSWFLNKNSSKSAHYIYTDVLMWVNDGILRTLTVIGHASLLLITTIIVIFVAPFAGLAGGGIVVFLAVVIVKLIKNPVADLAETRRDTAAGTLAAANQIFLGIKDIKLSQRKAFFIDSFLSAFSRYGYCGVRLRILQSIPPIVLLCLGQVGLIIIALIFWNSGNSSGEIAAQMALIVLVTSRVIPGVNKLVAEVSGMWAAIPHVEAIHHFFRTVASLKQKEETKNGGGKSIAAKWHSIDLENVSYRYPGGTEDALKNITIKLGRGGAYGIAGPSGAGKSTVVDLILGLIKPSSGSILLDGQPLENFSSESWHSLIGYVPQSPFLLDDTLRANVAFGEACDQIDDERVCECLRMASLWTFYKNLDGGLDAQMGDRGLRLSGGERQRVAIARALYSNPVLLVLDEATSALDSNSEQVVQEAIENLHGKITTITIAHRLLTIKQCDSIFVFDNGMLIDSGSFRQLRKKCTLFQELAAGIKSA